MIPKVIGLSLLVAASLSVHAQEEALPNPIDIALDSCLSIDTNQTTFGMVQCVMQAYDAWDAELNRQYKSLMAKLNTQEQSALREAQRKWIAYRDAELEFSGLMHTNLEGTLYKIFHAERVLALTKQRVLDLKSYGDTLSH